MTVLTETLLAVGAVTVGGGAVGYLLTHAAKLRLTIKADLAKLHAEFDKHAPNWRACACDSCQQRRGKAGVK
jgi:hypothetical protein